MDPIDEVIDWQKRSTHRNGPSFGSIEDAIISAIDRKYSPKTLNYKIVKLLHLGYTIREISRLINIPKSTLHRYIQRIRAKMGQNP